MKERWKDINGYEGIYMISDRGRVRNFRNGMFLKLQWRIRYYYRVGLTKSGCQRNFYVHRLVAIHFVPNPLNLPEVNHKKGKSNYYKNLEWCDRQGNMRHAVKNNLYWKGEELHNTFLTNEQVRLIKILLKFNYSSRLINKVVVGSTYSVITDIKRNRSWRHIKIR